MIKFIKEVAEVLWNITSIGLSLACIVALVYLWQQHVTCFDLVKWCVVH